MNFGVTEAMVLHGRRLTGSAIAGESPAFTVGVGALASGVRHHGRQGVGALR